MEDKTDKKIKKRYEKPKVIYAKKIEVISAVCGSARAGAGSGTCMKSSPCIKIYS